MAPLSISLFDRGYIPQPSLIVGGWNLPSYRSNPSLSFSGASAPMGASSAYYASSTYPSSALSVPMNTFPMKNLHPSSSISYEGSQFYGMSYPLHESPSSGGNVYPQPNNPCHAFLSSQTSASVMMPLQTSMDQLRGGYYPARQEHGGDQNPPWPTISQNQSFLGPWSQIPITATGLVTASHTGIISPTSASHVGDWSITFASYVEDQQPVVVSRDGGITLVALSHPDIASPTPAHHVPTSASHAENMSLAIVSDAGGVPMIEKPRRVRRKPKFFCRICEGDHLTHLFPATVAVPEAWSLPRGPLGSKSSLVSQYSMVDTTVMPMQSSADTPLPLRVYAPLDLVILHHVQPAVMPMKYSADNPLPFGGDVSLDLVVPHPIQPTIKSGHVDAIFGRSHSSLEE
jgi:hypothetical protein